MFTAESIGQDAVRHVAVLPDGTSVSIDPPPVTSVAARHVPSPPRGPTAPAGTTLRVPFGTVFGARSGDKGGDANLGVWARTDTAYEWLRGFLTVDRVRELLPETEPLTIERYELANLRALNLVVRGLLGPGVAGSTRFDPQAKALGEWLRSRLVDIPEGLR